MYVNVRKYTYLEGKSSKSTSSFGGPIIFRTTKAKDGNGNEV